MTYNISYTYNYTITIIKILNNKFGIKHDYINIIYPSMKEKNIINNYNNYINLIRFSVYLITQINTNFKKKTVIILQKFKNKFITNIIVISITNVTILILNIFLKDKINF
ncbi:hypothetical protein [Candidatus Purcelliella pentastirinorum]|nr:hypothetical protein [Candidatus Purcelliella pentastirinorum]